MTLHGQGEISQDVIATFPHEIFETDNANHEGEIFSGVVTLTGHHISTGPSITAVPAS
jgi:hypothetical protein